MAQAEEAKPQKNPKKILTFAFMGINLAVLGVGSYLVYISTLGYRPKSLSNAQAERELASFENSLHGDPVLYSMDPFDTNLSGVPRRLIRVQLTLEMMDQEGYEEVIGIQPEARDAIMRILNGKTFDDINTVQGKLRLKNQIIAKLNQSLTKGVVKNVFYNQFVVQ